MVQVETPVIVPGGNETVVHRPSVTQVPEFSIVPLETSTIWKGILPSAALVSQNWISLVAEGDIVEN
jgi:hypothetical protein